MYKCNFGVDKRDLCIKCNFGVDKRAIEEIGQLVTLTSSPHLAADRSYISMGLHPDRFALLRLHPHGKMGRQLQEGVGQKCR